MRRGRTVVAGGLMGIKWRWPGLCTLVILLFGTTRATAQERFQSLEFYWGFRPHSEFSTATAASALRIEHFNGYLRLWAVDEVCAPLSLRVKEGDWKKWRYRSTAGGPEIGGPPRALRTLPGHTVLGVGWNSYETAEVLWLSDRAGIAWGGCMLHPSPSTAVLCTGLLSSTAYDRR